MFLVLVGNVKAEECKTMLERFVVNKFSGNVIRENFDALDKINTHYIEQDMKMSVPTNLIGFKDVTRSTNYIRKLIVFEMIHRMFFRAASNFYEKIYKDGIINGSYYTDYINENDYGYYLFGGDGDSFKNFLRFYLVITITMIFQKISMFLSELRKPCMEIISTCLIILTIFHN